ncbi:hypothetical protein KAFR_0D04390 [Kazachstania africana CBS 2517]|uniref:Peroxin-3 n=1 Tax=Kazachstania africana (strain ATCC 22294 / BCRC 22015 / CBS 2517 / CECT 1963 / NBRC 1671 / NRRL Y-8276) TaxID=1071382 RepID=H2AUN7_KAZAF|nr:hypothetical protein KAFR_0D04390 [Kazachstania africana CBS 2517]CCF58087.1 hypothetical protein KAFR_0D04390 [Kazachstania africana CBS 2517]
MSARDQRSLIQRHRGKLVFTLTMVSGFVMTTSMLIYCLKTWLVRQQRRFNEERFIKEQIKRRFQITQEDSLITVYELLPVVSMVLNDNDMDLNGIFGALKEKKNYNGNSDTMSYSTATAVGSDVPATKTKAELWSDLKVKSLIKVVTTSYVMSSLLLLAKLQLNMLTRREYLDTALRSQRIENQKSNNSSFLQWVTSTIISSVRISDNDLEDDTNKVDQVTYINEQAFLSLSWWLLNRGWLKYRSIVEREIDAQFKDLGPKDVLTLKEFSTKLNEVFYKINLETLDGLSNILLPEEKLESFVLQQTLDSGSFNVLANGQNIVLKRLINETQNYLKSNVSKIIMEQLINESFQYIMNSTEDKIKSKKKESDGKNQIALISICLKDVCNEMLVNGNLSINNAYLNQLNAINELNDLCVSVYSNFML